MLVEEEHVLDEHHPALCEPSDLSNGNVSYSTYRLRHDAEAGEDASSKVRVKALCEGAPYCGSNSKYLEPQQDWQAPEVVRQDSRQDRASSESSALADEVILDRVWRQLPLSVSRWLAIHPTQLAGGP